MEKFKKKYGIVGVFGTSAKEVEKVCCHYRVFIWTRSGQQITSGFSPSIADGYIVSKISHDNEQIVFDI